MNSFVVLMSPLALVLPLVAGGLSDGARQGSDVARASPDGEPLPPLGFRNPALAPWRALEQARREPIQNQVRIEQRVIVRIAPSSRSTFDRALAEAGRDAESFQEAEAEDCLPINMISAVHPQKDRLLLFMRDRRLFSAKLERACNPEQFYAGFYIERQDGRLCTQRDRLQSRAGASCQVTRLSRLVAARD